MVTQQGCEVGHFSLNYLSVSGRAKQLVNKAGGNHLPVTATFNFFFHVFVLHVLPCLCSEPTYCPAHYESLFHSNMCCTSCSWVGTRLWSFHTLIKPHQLSMTAVPKPPLSIALGLAVLVRTRVLTLTQVNCTHDQLNRGSAKRKNLSCNDRIQL